MNVTIGIDIYMQGSEGAILIMNEKPKTHVRKKVIPSVLLRTHSRNP